MELNTIKCPACGANVHFRPGKNKTTCEYCGSTVVNEDQYGRDDILELADSINNLASSLEERDDCRNKLWSTKVQYNDAVQRYKDLQSRRLLEIFKYSACSVAVGVLFALIAIGESEWGCLVVTVIAAALVRPLYQYALARYEENLKEMRETLRRYKNTIADYQAELDRINEETDFSIVPERYLDVDALTFISNVLYSGEAYDLHQAMAQYNTECKRREERDALRAQLEAQKRQLDEIQSDQRRGRRSDDADTEQMEDTLKTVAATGAALYTGYKIIKAITRL